MNVYAETSAVLRWLLGAPGGEEARTTLAGAATVVTSRLTLVEARRALTRAASLGEVREAEALQAGELLARATAHWSLVEVAADLLERASQRFPVEPVRTLDAVHLATALSLVSALDGLVVLSTDERVRRNAAALGLGVAPA